MLAGPAPYDVKSALSSLTDEAVGSFTAMAALTGKATKATTEEMVGTFAGAMAQTVASFKTNGRQMADAIKNIGAVAAANNVPLQEQLAILGQLQTTMPGSEAGTLYKAFIMKASEAGEKLGLSLVDSSGRLKGIILILEEVKGKYPDLSQAAAQVEIKRAFGSDEAVKFLLQVSQGMAALETNIQSVAGAMRTGTAVTEQMAQSMNRDIGARLKLVGQQIGNFSQILGRTLLPMVTTVLTGFSRMVLFFQGLARAAPGLTRVVLTPVLGARRRAHRGGRGHRRGRDHRFDAAGDQGRTGCHGPLRGRGRRGLCHLLSSGRGYHRRRGAGRLPAEKILGEQPRRHPRHHPRAVEPHPTGFLGRARLDLVADRRHGNDVRWGLSS